MKPGIFLTKSLTALKALPNADAIPFAMSRGKSSESLRVSIHSRKVFNAFLIGLAIAANIPVKSRAPSIKSLSFTNISPTNAVTSSILNPNALRSCVSSLKTVKTISRVAKIPSSVLLTFRPFSFNLPVFLSVSLRDSVKSFKDRIAP